MVEIGQIIQFSNHKIQNKSMKREMVVQGTQPHTYIKIQFHSYFALHHNYGIKTTHQKKNQYKKKRHVSAEVRFKNSPMENGFKRSNWVNNEVHGNQSIAQFCFFFHYCQLWRIFMTLFGNMHMHVLFLSVYVVQSYVFDTPQSRLFSYYQHRWLVS